MWRWLFVLLVFPMAASAAEIPVIVYHDIVKSAGNPYAVRESDFREQMRFLKRAGYHPIRLADYANAAQHGAALPDKPVLLTFDDGLRSFQDIVLPVLEQYGFPAVLGVTTGWLDGRDIPDNYRDRLLTPEALRKVSQSPLVEILSHTDRLHDAIPADPFGSLAPASVTRRYLGPGRYESEAAYRARVRADLRHSRDRLAGITGKPPAGVVWPYGYFNSILVEEAATLGMRTHLTLDDTIADTRDYPRINRRLLERVRNLGDFEKDLQIKRRESPLRLLAFRLDSLVTRDRGNTENNLSNLIEQVRLMRVNVVILSPYTSDGKRSFYSGTQRPVVSDILHRVLHQLRMAAGVQAIILRLPRSHLGPAEGQELARRHPYDAILLDGQPDAGEVTRLLKLFRYYRPMLRCGTERPGANTHCADYRIMHVHAAHEVSDRQAESRQNTMPTYYLVSTGMPDKPGQTAQLLRKIRHAGARHYGLELQNGLESPVELREVAMEMAQASGGSAQ